MGVADGFMEMKTHCFSMFHASNTFHVSLQHVTDGSLHHPCSQRTGKGCFILENTICLALKRLWLYRRWSTPCCYPSLTLCYMVWACEHSGNPAELCDSRDVPALRTHPLPAAGKTIKHTHMYTHANSLIMYAPSCSHCYKLIMFNFKTLLSRVRKVFALIFALLNQFILIPWVCVCVFLCVGMGACRLWMMESLFSLLGKCWWRWWLLGS